MLRADGIDKNSDGLLEEVEIKAIQSISYHYAGISDFTGIEYFTELTNLELIGNNNASKIPIENLTKLELLNLSYTNITSADVSKLTNLSNLQLAGTGISSIDLSKNTKLEYLSLADCSSLTSLDLSNNKSLINVQLQTTGISDFQIAGYSYLEELWLTNCNIEKVRITDCPKLTRIEMPKGTSAVDISGCTSLKSLDVSGIKNTLYMFEANNSGLRGVVDLSYCSNLQIVEMDNCNYITGVNVSDCYSLSTLSVRDGSALYVDASNCLALNFPEVSDNVYYAGYGAETVDYSQVEGFNIWGVTVISGGSYSEGVFTFDEGSTMIVYNYYLTNDAYGQFIIMAE